MKRQPVTLYTTLEHFPWVLMRFRCHYCARSAELRLVTMALRFGPHAPVGRLLRRFMADCPYDPYNPSHKPRKYGHKCGAYCPDVLSPRPPDLPPSMSGLTLIEGGKADMLPASPSPIEKRRRVGGVES